MMTAYTLAIAYYEGMSGNTLVRLVRGEKSPAELRPTDIGLTDEDSFNSVQIMYDECAAIAWTNETEGNFALLFDVTSDGGNEACDQGYEVALVETYEGEAAEIV